MSGSLLLDVQEPMAHTAFASLLDFDDDQQPATTTMDLASSAGMAVATAAAVAKPPPPPPPPPPPAVDLNEVYRPYEDPLLQSSFAPKPIGDMLVGTQAAAAALLFEDSAAKPRDCMASVSLLDFDEPYTTTKQPLLLEESRSSGLLASLPPGVPAAEDLDKPAGGMVIDLSKPPKEPPSNAGEDNQTPKLNGRSRSAWGDRPIPTDSKGFGSEDLFGTGSQEKSLQESLQDNAAVAYNALVAYLPEQVKQQVPRCTVPANDDIETEVAVGAAAAGAVGRPAPVLQLGRSMEEQHSATAVSRAYEGRWVPTYMRHQLAANGHLTLPRAPNGHEHPATTAPPSLSQAFAEMGAELGESAQSVLESMLQVLSSLSFQCQLCTHDAATSIHDQVMTFGDNICSSVGQEDEAEVSLVRPPGEAAYLPSPGRPTGGTGGLPGPASGAEAGNFPGAMPQAWPPAPQPPTPQLGGGGGGAWDAAAGQATAAGNDRRGALVASKSRGGGCGQEALRESGIALDSQLLLKVADGI